MAKQIEGARQLIEDRGGVNYVRDVLGWPYSTVDTFARNDRAPEYRWKVIEALPVKPKPPEADTQSEPGSVAA